MTRQQRKQFKPSTFARTFDLLVEHADGTYGVVKSTYAKSAARDWVSRLGMRIAGVLRGSYANSRVVRIVMVPR